MPDQLTVKTPLEHTLKVGFPSENYIAFEITAAQVMKKLEAEISIPCGKPAPDKTYLSADGKRAKLMPKSEKLTFLTQPLKEASISWKSNTFTLQAGEKLTIRIAGFNPERSGDSSLQLKIGEIDQSYPVSIVSVSGPAIIYFDASPTNALQRDEITISGTTTGANTLELFANGAIVSPKSSNTGQTETVNKYTHKPEEDTVYRLKAWQTTPGKPGRSDEEEEADVIAGKLARRKITVSVTSRPAWYSRDLLANSLGQAGEGLHFYPALLLNGKDLSGETAADVLYGIFVCKETKQAGLWSSISGVDDWSFLGNVPEGMAESPGVIHNEALWLIGGSSTNPLGNVSNRVCWYYKNKDNEMVWREWDEDGSERKAAMAPAPRRCHACAAFGGKVWVLGGLSDKNTTLDDVWTCSADPVTGKFIATWEPSKSLPSGRCLSVVTATPWPTKMRGVGEPRLWLFGGTTHPYNLDETFYELLWTQDGKAWNSFDLPEKKASGPKEEATGEVQVLAGTLLYDASDQHLHVTGMFRSSGKAIIARDYELLDVTITNGWSQTSPEFGWDFQTDLFLIRSASFRERWIFAPVYQDGTGDNNAKIYITKARK